MACSSCGKKIVKPNTIPDLLDTITVKKASGEVVKVPKTKVVVVGGRKFIR